LIITTGKSIKIDVGTWALQLERSCETPGLVTVRGEGSGVLSLPANLDEAERFIAAYRRAIEEDIPYREMRSG
jgi:hypothetical protein